MPLPQSQSVPARGRGRPRVDDDLFFYVAVSAEQRKSGLKLKEFTDRRGNIYHDPNTKDWHGHWRSLSGRTLRRRYYLVRRMLGVEALDKTTDLDGNRYPGAFEIDDTLERMIVAYMNG